jgi:hypothetical protein
MITEPQSPAAAFALGYQEGDSLRRAGVSPDDEDGTTRKPPCLPVNFPDDWEQGFKAGIRGEPSMPVSS